MSKVRIAMWSGPRNISTAMMRAWENRGDCEVIDEPLYAHYLQQTGIEHPGRAEIIAAGDTDWRRVAARLTAAPAGEQTISYQKHMTHHLLPHIGREWLASLVHVFLIRDPRKVVLSYVRSRPAVNAADIGVLQQREIYDYVRHSAAADPLVIDADDFLAAPEAQLRALCARLGVEFSPRMLSWAPGPRPSDGVWARYWYEQVYRSTGFERPAGAATVTVPRGLQGLIDEVMPAFESMRVRRLRT